MKQTYYNSFCSISWLMFRVFSRLQMIIAVKTLYKREKSIIGLYFWICFGSSFSLITIIETVFQSLVIMVSYRHVLNLTTNDFPVPKTQIFVSFIISVKRKTFPCQKRRFFSVAINSSQEQNDIIPFLSRRCSKI